MEKKTILIIDDNESFAKMTKLFLEGTGEFTVEYETDSSQAITTARNVRPNLILLDLVMPHLDGGDVQALLSKDPFLHDTPILFITSMVSQDDTPEGSLVQSGDNLMLPKTSKPEFIHRAIQQRLAGEI